MNNNIEKKPRPGKGLLGTVRTDFIKARLVSPNDSFNFIVFTFLLLKSKTARIQTAIRFRSANWFLSTASLFYLKLFFIEVGKDTQIGEFFFLPHPRCIIIADNVILGNYVNIGQYATIGGNFKKTKTTKTGMVQKLPIIGNNVVVAAGAVVGGPVTIGNDVIIGANAVVTKDIPNNKIVTGNNKISTRDIKVDNTCGEYKYLG
jgi:serine O-acetyltransferase